MNNNKSIASRLLSLFVAVLVFNISMNVSDNLVGKAGPGYKYVNEIETVVEFIAEVVLSSKDVIPENQIPGGILGFEEEEKHFLEDNYSVIFNGYIPDTLYENNLINSEDFGDHIAEVPTPPPDHSLLPRS